MRELNVGDKVVCRYFNKPEGVFYGGTFTGTIIKKNNLGRNARDFTILKEDKSTCNMWKREVLFRVDAPLTTVERYALRQIVVENARIEVQTPYEWAAHFNVSVREVEDAIERFSILEEAL